MYKVWGTEFCNAYQAGLLISEGGFKIQKSKVQNPNLAQLPNGFILQNLQSSNHDNHHNPNSLSRPDFS